MTQILTTYVEVRPRGRLAKINHRPITAMIDLGYADDGRYVFPTVAIGFAEVDAAGKFDRLASLATVKFQRHHRSQGYDLGAWHQPRGLLAMPAYSHAYGAEIRANLTASTSRSLPKVLALIDRARAAVPRARTERQSRALDCDLQRLALGLRLVGVALRVYRRRPAYRTVLGGHGSLAVAS